MFRESLLKELEIYESDFPDEQATTQKFRKFIADYENCFSRSLTVGHVTASCWLLSLDRKKVLLTRHKKLNKWLQLGGHCDGEGNTALAALKEAREESGIEKIALVKSGFFDIDIHEIPRRKNEEAHLHYDLRYVLGVQYTDRFKVSSESHNLDWVPFENLPIYTEEESVLRMDRKWRKLAES